MKPEVAYIALKLALALLLFCLFLMCDSLLVNMSSTAELPILKGVFLFSGIYVFSTMLDSLYKKAN